MARIDFGSSTNQHTNSLESDGVNPVWHGFRREDCMASPFGLNSPQQQQQQQQQQCHPESVESFVLDVMRNRAVHVSPAALDFSSHAVMDMVCAAHRNRNHCSLALVPYKTSDDVLIQSLTAFQQKEQHRQRRQQHLSLVLDRLQQQQQEQQQHQHQQQQQQQQQQDDHTLPHIQPSSPESCLPLHPAHKRRRLAARAESDMNGGMDSS